MIVAPRKIEEILNGSKKYVIPSYQRPYRWTEDNIDEFLQDIWDSLQENSDKEYFLGSIICCKIKEGGKEIYEVVDGQQRLITITLVMCQLAELIDKDEIKYKIRERFIFKNVFADNGVEDPALTVRKQEKDVYMNILRKEGSIGNLTKDENVFLVNNKKIRQFFQDNLGSKQDSLRKFAEYLIKQVEVFEVLSEDRLSSFRLFKVLNDRGLSLAYTDLLKNELIERAYIDGKEQKEREVEQQWTNLEEIVQEIGLGRKGKKNIGDSMELFFSILQVSEKTNRDRVRKDIHTYYKAQLMSKLYGGDSLKMIRTILGYAKALHDVCNDKSSKQTMFFLKGFYKNTIEWAPAVIAFLNKYGTERFPEFVQLLEKVYIQRWIVRGTASKREEPSYYAVEAINTQQSIGEHVSERTVDDILNVLRERSDNKAVRKALVENNFYEKGAPARNNFILLILLRLGAKEKDIQTYHVGDLTVEHVLPEEWHKEPYWKQRFSQEEYDEWLNKIGNLTVIGRKGNASIKNKGFDVKKPRYQEFNLAITKDIGNRHDEWRVPQIKERHAELIKEIEELCLVK